jgi:hypothetical protein
MGLPARGARRAQAANPPVPGSHVCAAPKHAARRIRTPWRSETTATPAGRAVSVSAALSNSRTIPPSRILLKFLRYPMCL